jgi:hypothetical protein
MILRRKSYSTEVPPDVDCASNADFKWKRRVDNNEQRPRASSPCFPCLEYISAQSLSRNSSFSFLSCRLLSTHSSARDRRCRLQHSMLRPLLFLPSFLSNRSLYLKMSLDVRTHHLHQGGTVLGTFSSPSLSLQLQRTCSHFGPAPCW